jgi:nitrite reductase/ring-hydroxylating ferredoxin subunit
VGTNEEGGTPRRALLAGAGAAGIAVALGGCAAYGNTGGGGAPAKNDGGSTTGASAGASGGNGGSKALAQVDEIPVGGGKIFEAEQVVVTQPKKGTIKAFSATCTHQGCTVAEVKGGTINCPCHGSKFKVADGSVANGPANKPLPPVIVTVDGTAIKLA